MWEFILGIVLGVFIYYKILKPASFWEDKGITFEPKAWPIIGNMKDFATRKKHLSETVCDLYKKYPNDRYVGIMQFSSPALLLRDLELIKKICVKEFESFHDHMGLAKAESDPLLSNSLINLLGEDWKKMRATLSPAFTSSKMRNMYQLMTECSENLVKHFNGKGSVNLEMKDLLSRFANDVIATTAFGIPINSVKDPNHEFYTMGKSLTEFNVKQFLKVLLFVACPKLLKMLNIPMLPNGVSTFYTKIIMDNIDKRVKQGIVRPDLIHLLLEARKGNLQHDIQEEKHEGFATVEESHIGKSTKQMELTDEHIIAQAILFFFAGFETVSSAASLMAYELGANPEIQMKLREEIDEVARNYANKVPYDAILSMKYLDQVVCESLRLWPPGFQTDRLCNKNYTIEPINSNEIKFVVQKGMTMLIPVMAIHRDPKYFPNPERFDPERFNDENKAKIVPGSYMPFGVGPRNCIGSRFALLELKTLFFHLLTQFEIVPNEKTEIPLKISPKKASLLPENGLQLTLKPRYLL